MNSKENITTVRRLTGLDIPELIQDTQCPMCKNKMDTLKKATYVRLNGRCIECNTISDILYQEQLSSIGNVKIEILIQ